MHIGIDTLRPAFYLTLGANPTARQAAYRELFRSELEPELIDSIQLATNGNFALGDERFGKAISRALGTRVTPGATGRPRKFVKEDGGEVD